MKQNSQQIRNKLLTVIMAGVAGASFATAATAAGVGANVGAGAQITAPDKAQAGGSAGAHMSTPGSANTNAQWQSEATRGADRAAARMDMNVDALEQATTAAGLEAAGKATANTKRPATR